MFKRETTLFSRRIRYDRWFLARVQTRGGPWLHACPSWCRVCMSVPLCSKINSSVVSTFTAAFVMNWYAPRPKSQVPMFFSAHGVAPHQHAHTAHRRKPLYRPRFFPDQPLLELPTFDGARTHTHTHTNTPTQAIIRYTHKQTQTQTHTKHLDTYVYSRTPRHQGVSCATRRTKTSRTIWPGGKSIVSYAPTPKPSPPSVEAPSLFEFPCSF